MQKEKFRIVRESSVVVLDGEILLLYVTGDTDPNIMVAAKHLKTLGEQMKRFYKVKPHSFYRMSYRDPDAIKQIGYRGKNFMDGMIMHIQPYTKSAVIDYHWRDTRAAVDDSFLYNLVYSYSALYQLEEQYTPAVAKYRYTLSQEASYPGAFPGVPRSMHSATTVGASEDFASSIHNDSGVDGVTETIIWTTPSPGKKQYFVLPTVRLAFDLCKVPCVILQSPKVPHGTADTGNHGGYGFVNITKSKLVSNSPFTGMWYKLWKAIRK